MDKRSGYEIFSNFKGIEFVQEMYVFKGFKLQQVPQVFFQKQTDIGWDFPYITVSKFLDYYGNWEENFVSWYHGLKGLLKH